VSEPATPYPASSMPYGFSAPPEPAARPRLVEVAFWLYLVTAALGIVGVVLTIIGYGAVRAQAIDRARRELEAQGQGGVLPQGTFEGILDVAFGVGIALGIIGALLYVLFGIFVRRGANWARIVLTVFAGLAVLGALFTLLSLAVPGIGAGAGAAAPGSRVLSVTSCLCLIAATVLVWQRPSNDWFRQVKEYRRFRRESGFGSSAPRSA
jgi:hypothetical protein